ncbi:MAG: preprotein translocase subunit SecE [Gammaproteobacteria bacterium]|jgi:preprotein translocase subunit SecE
MGSKQEKTTSKFDVVKFVLIAVLIIGGFVAHYYLDNSAQIPWPIIVVGWLVLVCVAAFIALQTALGRKFWKFVREARNEMRKVVWPTRQQTIKVTFMVIAIVIVFAVIMWVFDTILLHAVNWLTG